MKKLKHVLIVLGCGPKRDGKPSQCMISRARKAIQLHRKNNYSAIILSGGVNVRKTPPEAVIMRVMLLNHLPHEKTLVEPNSRTTVQNALFCWELLKDRNPKSITVVTSMTNIKRTRHIFEKLYAHMGVSLKFEAAEDAHDPFEKVYYWLRELCAMAYYRVVGIR